MKLGGRRVEEGSGEHTNSNYQPSFISQKETSLSPNAKLLKEDIGDVGGREPISFFFHFSAHLHLLYIFWSLSQILEIPPLYDGNTIEISIV